MLRSMEQTKIKSPGHPLYCIFKGDGFENVELASFDHFRPLLLHFSFPFKGDLKRKFLLMQSKGPVD